AHAQVHAGEGVGHEEIALAFAFIVDLRADPGGGQARLQRGGFLRFVEGEFGNHLHRHLSSRAAAAGKRRRSVSMIHSKDPSRGQARGAPWRRNKRARREDNGRAWFRWFTDGAP